MLSQRHITAARMAKIRAAVHGRCLCNFRNRRQKSMGVAGKRTGSFLYHWGARPSSWGSRKVISSRSKVRLGL